jgi:hypothetical protein
MFSPLFIKESILLEEVEGWEATIFSQKGFFESSSFEIGYATTSR